jgi:cytochrome P450
VSARTDQQPARAGSATKAVEPDPPRTVPGPRGHPIFGNVPALQRDPVQTFVDAWRQYGDAVHLWMGGPLNAYLFVHPDAVRHVLQDNHQGYVKHPHANRALSDTIGNGLLTSAGAYWLRQRRLIQPAFHRQRLASLGRLITDATERAVESWGSVARAGSAVDVASEMMHLTLDIVARAMFSADVRDAVGRVEAAMKVTLAQAMRRTQSHRS